MHSRFYASSLLMISLGASSCALLDASQVCINDGTLFGCADIEDGENVLPSDSGTLIPDDPEEEPVAAPEFPSWPILVNPPISNYQDNNDGTVLDVTTSLLWQKETGSIGISYIDAEQACAGLVLGNKTDWRLPTAIELFSIVNQQRSAPTSTFPNMASAIFWSSTPVVNSTGHRWGVSFTEGTDVDLDENNINGSVLSRCVRSDPQTNTEQYTIEGETILDNLTGLIWQREASEGTFTLESAIDFCDNLDLAGISDWRLPHIQELRSIVDRTTSNPALDTTAFSALDTEFFWSNTSVIGSSGFFNWAIVFATGFDNDVPNTNALRVRCVR